MKIIPHIKTCDVLVCSLLNNSCTKFHISSHADVIKIIGHELVRLMSGDVVECSAQRKVAGLWRL